MHRSIIIYTISCWHRQYIGDRRSSSFFFNLYLEALHVQSFSIFTYSTTYAHAKIKIAQCIVVQYNYNVPSTVLLQRLFLSNTIKNAFTKYISRTHLLNMFSEHVSRMFTKHDHLTRLVISFPERVSGTHLCVAGIAFAYRV